MWSQVCKKGGAKHTLGLNPEQFSQLETSVDEDYSEVFNTDVTTVDDI
jgi:hypothetical protein